LVDLTKPINEGVPPDFLKYLSTLPEDERLKVFVGMGYSAEAIITYLHAKPVQPAPQLQAKGPAQRKATTAKTPLFVIQERNTRGRHSRYQQAILALA